MTPTTKQALAAAAKAFSATPSAINWKVLEAAMYAHQEAFQTAKAIKAYNKVLAQG